jgi:hypothetical protein
MERERSGNTASDDDRCDFLRWKGLFIDAEWDRSVPHSGDRNFWCHRTQNCLGPDGRVVDEYECNETRSCYREL